MSTPVVLNPLTVVADGYGRTVGVTADERFKVDILTTNVLADHAETHEAGGIDEINGDLININYNPSNYFEGDGYLGSHLEGIDDAIGDILDGLDGYCTVDKCEEFQLALDGYAQQTQVTNIQLALDGYCTVETCEEFDERVTNIQNALDGYDGYNIFGTGLLYNEDEGSSFTTCAGYKNKLTLTTNSLEAGNYYIGWSAEILAPNGNAKNIDVRVVLDDTTTISKIRSEEDSSFTPAAGFKVLYIDSGVHTIDMDWKRAGPSGSAGIRRARIVIWRVS